MRILLVTPTFLPESVGGTEVYVDALARELNAGGDEAHVAVSTRDAPEQALERFRPDIVHCHPLTGVDLLPWMQAARERSLQVVCTYHTPTLTCGRGDLRLFGESACDGVIETRRCALCVMQQKGLPRTLGAVALGIAPKTVRPPQWLPRKVRSLLSIPAQRRAALEGWMQVRGHVASWVAPARWVAEVLRANGVPAERITTSRQGVACADAAPVRNLPATTRSIGYLGRIHRHKGIDILLEAVSRIPRAQIEVRVAGSGDVNYEAELHERFQDPRIQWLGALRPSDTRAFLQGLDVLVVPSLMLETGPLTVPEAWAAGTPVIGTSSGGIAEWIDEFGGGVTFPRGDAAALAKLLERWTEGAMTIPAVPSPVRTMAAVAREMRGVYERAGASCTAT